MVRPIVKDAFKCDALVYQFTEVDVENGILTDGGFNEVDAKKSDAEIISDAKNRLHICNDEFNLEDDYYVEEARQLRRFLRKWKV